MVIPFPAYRPTSVELQLPNYRVITNSWRATEAPEILGSLPEDARLRLRYENITDAEALELLLLWRATAGGYYPLNTLPAEVAAGINDAAMADRILNTAPLSWVVAEMPRQQSVKAGRSTVDIELKTELRFVPVIPTPAATCPVYVERQDTRCGASPVEPAPPENPEYSFNFAPFLVNVEWSAYRLYRRISCTTGADTSVVDLDFSGTLINIRGNSFFTATRVNSGVAALGNYLPGSGPIEIFLNPPGASAACGGTGFYNSNGVVIWRGLDGAFMKSDLWGGSGNISSNQDNTGTFHRNTIDRIILRENVPGLGAIGDDITSLAAVTPADYSAIPNIP